MTVESYPKGQRIISKSDFSKEKFYLVLQGELQ
jgi:hypothetical protein